MSTQDPIDVLIIGAGPAGSAAASILAEKNHRVVVLERERFPRYHIGESMIPFTYQPLERLGLIPQMRSSAFVKKYSVQFVAPHGRASQPFYFFNRYDRDTVAQTWQVLRSEFDQMLVDHARQRGATVLEEIRVDQLIKENGRVCGVAATDSRGASREFRAALTLDCSGKESFAAVREGWRVKDPKLNKVAVWTYYTGAKRDPGIDEGGTTVAFIPHKGWFWYIPLHDDRVSVGVVADGKYLSRDNVRDPREMFEREIGENLWIQDHLSTGQQTGPHYITSEYSFHSRHCGCEGLLLAGDAYCFLDPVFSSGLLLALKSGVMAADEIHDGLQAGDLSPGRFTGYARAMREGIENMRKLVYAFYDDEFSFRKLTDKHPELAGDVTDCLSGDVAKDFSKLFHAVAEFCDIPEPLPYGTPLQPAEPLNA